MTARIDGSRPWGALASLAVFCGCHGIGRRIRGFYFGAEREVVLFARQIQPRRDLLTAPAGVSIPPQSNVIRLALAK